jgi:plastocyanin
MRRKTVSYLSLFVAALAVFLIGGTQSAQQPAKPATTPAKTIAQQDPRFAYHPRQYVVALIVDDNKVTASPDTLQVWVGDTIEWQIAANGPASFESIKFLDTDPVAREAGVGKVKNAKATGLGALCGSVGPGPCYLTIDKDHFDMGHYKYLVTVKHNGKLKKSDPDVEVTCTTPPCVRPKGKP